MAEARLIVPARTAIEAFENLCPAILATNFCSEPS